MGTITSSKGISRRELLKRCMVVGAGLAVGTGFVAGSTASWAMETNHVTPSQMATLIQMARDIYPHDHIGDQYYAAAVKGFDSADSKDRVAAGIDALDAAAQGQGFTNYLSVPWVITTRHVCSALLLLD